jgi:hypothetical protein
MHRYRPFTVVLVTLVACIAIISIVAFSRRDGYRAQPSPQRPPAETTSARAHPPGEPALDESPGAVLLPIAGIVGAGGMIAVRNRRRLRRNSITAAAFAVCASPSVEAAREHLVSG